MTDEDLIFVDEQQPDDGSGTRPWVVLIVDDEEEIHAVTKLALTGFEFGDRPLKFLSAYSGSEARSLLKQRDDIAMILLDVVMENDHAGLDVVRYVRDTLRNRFVRIVLRTGQPGQAPERDVIRDYDINDYKEKTELTAKKLYTVMYSALRSYRDLLMIDANRRGLVHVLEASSKLYAADSVDRFIQGVLEQLASLIYAEVDMAYISSDSSGVAARRDGGGENIVAATGAFAPLVGKDPRNALTPPDYHNLNLAIRKQRSVMAPTHFSGYFATPGGTEHLLYIAGKASLSAPDQTLIDVFLKNVSVIYESVAFRSESAA